MTQKLHVIVHEAVVSAEALVGNQNAQRVLETILRIKGGQSQQVIEIVGAPRHLSPEMPAPADGLEVEVSGAYKQGCIASQLYALRKAGYTAKLHPNGCLDGSQNLPEITRKLILEEFPDFFNE